MTMERKQDTQKGELVSDRVWVQGVPSFGLTRRLVLGIAPHCVVAKVVRQHEDLWDFRDGAMYERDGEGGTEWGRERERYIYIDRDAS